MVTPFIGEIRMFAGNFAPRGWALCNGQILPVSQNDALFSLFGTIYGGDGRTTFALPDLRGRVPIHWGNGPGLTSRRIGEKGGAERVTLTADQLPSHKHTLRGTTANATSRDPAGRLLAAGTSTAYGGSQSSADRVNMHSAATGNSGGSQPHDNVMPFQCINYIVALTGVFPSRS